MEIRYSKEIMKKFGNIIYNYFLKQFNKINRRYYVRPNNLKDLAEFMKESQDDLELMKFAQNKFLLKFGSLKKIDYDELIIDILRYVYSHLNYRYDSDKWKVPEYWQTARQTFESQTGDCEDGAILILTLARLCGVPANRIFVTCGWAMFNKQKIGHAYNEYIGNDGITYILDWNIHYSRSRIPSRKNKKTEAYYLKPRWFKCNDQGTYIKKKR